MALHSIFISFRATAFLSHPPTPVYIASFVLQVYVVQTWEFFLALGYEKLCLFRPLFATSPGVGTVPITTYVICIPSFVCVTCAFEYASTNLEQFCRSVGTRTRAALFGNSVFTKRPDRRSCVAHHWQNGTAKNC